MIFQAAGLKVASPAFTYHHTLVPKVDFSNLILASYKI